MEDRFPSIECEHCDRLTTWPIWARVELGCYQALCSECFDRLTQSFSADLAILQAELIIAIRQGTWQPHQIGGAK